MKSLFKSKTFWVAVLQGVLGVVLAVETSFPTVGWVVVAKSVIDIVLRVVSSESVYLGFKS